MLIPPKQIPRIHLLFHIIQAFIIPIRNNTLTHFLKLLQVIHNSASKECTSIFQRRFIDNHCSAFRLYPFHHSLDTALPEVIRMTLHRQTVNTDHNFFFFRHIVFTVGIVAAGQFQYTICNKILPGSVSS